MGWSISLIIVQHPEPQLSEQLLLQQLGFSTATLAGDTTLEECLYPRDKTLNMGVFNDCLLITDDYQLTAALDFTPPADLTKWEQVLTALYPGSEILTVACHSGVNYHVYSLVKGGIKLRYKRITADDPLVEFGNRLPEEDAVYAYSTIVNGQRLFRSSYKDTDVYDMTEDQFMEDFTFGVAKRLLGVEISKGGDEELMNDIVFHKYQVKLPAMSKKPAPGQQQTFPSSPLAQGVAKKSWWGKMFGK